jgi:5-methyltetrahydropteroyltriglutamate--homocysteine methyltransferase
MDRRETNMNRFRGDQVGSLLRPSSVLEARAAFQRHDIELAELRRVEDAAILETLEMQRASGIDVLSDGEFRRGSWLTSMAESVEGFVPASTMLRWHGPGGGDEASTSQIVGAPLRRRQRLTEIESAFLRDHAGGPYKVTFPSPAVFQVSSFRAGVTDKVYPTRRDLLEALVPIVRAEIEALVDEGTPYIQLDDPFLTVYMDPDVRERMTQDGRDIETEIQDGIDIVNTCLDGIERPNTVVGLHICRGNSKSRWFTSGGYEPLAERLFSSLGVDRFLLEYDDERSGGFEPLRFVPSGKTTVLGLLTTKRSELESFDELRRSIDQAARYTALDDLALSPQCGFASVASGNLISMDDQRRKLEQVAKTARAVWG